MEKFLRILVIAIVFMASPFKLQCQTNSTDATANDEKPSMYYYSTIPYYCDLDNEREANFWDFKNISAGNNEAHWYIWGNQNTYHYLMCGVGQDDYYTEGSPVTVLAERGIYLGNSNTVTVSFNITVGGEAGFDYCMAFLAPADVEWEPATGGNPDYLGSSNAWNLPYALHFGDGVEGTKLSNKNNETMTTTITNPAPGQPYKLIFVWHNDNVDGNGTAVTIRNISVTSEITPMAISSINVTGFTTPEWGAHPDTDLAGSSNYYSVEVAHWHETTPGYSGAIMDSDDIFDNLDNYDYNYGNDRKS